MSSSYFSWLTEKKKQKRNEQCITSVFPGVPSFWILCQCLWSMGSAKASGVEVWGLVPLFYLHNSSWKQSCPCPTCLAPSVQPLSAAGHVGLLPAPATCCQHLGRSAFEPCWHHSQAAGLTTPLYHLHLRPLLVEQKIVLIWGNCFFPSLCLQNNLSFLKSSFAKDYGQDYLFLFPKLGRKVLPSALPQTSHGAGAQS